MNIKCESEIKIEELDFEYDSYQQDSQIFCDNELDFTLKTEDIKIEELEENVSIKSELTESEKESVLDEGLVNDGVIKSENVMMIEEKSCGQHSKMMKADDDGSDDLNDNRSITEEEIDETMLLSKNDHDMEEDESSFEEEEEFEGFIHSDNFKERSNLLNKMILQLRNLQSSFPHIESIIPLPESIKKELDENSSFIKSEPRESDLEFVFNEEKIKNDVIKSKNSPMKKFDVHHKFMSVKNVCSLLNKVNKKGLKAHFESDEEEYFAQILTSKFPLLLLKQLSYKDLMTLMMNAAEGEKDLDVKSTSKSKKPQRAAMHRKIIKKYQVENLSCRHCNFSFKSKDELKTHLKTHNKRKFKCAHCSYECNFKSTLKRHMLIHSNIKLYKCSHCSYECNQKGSLNIHMLAHANVKLFKCSYCSYESNHKYHLKIHMFTHTNVKLFKCSHCSYECIQKGQLKTHMFTHTNIKLFKCSYCSYECNYKGSLKIHMLTHANIKLFKCSDCSYECNRKAHLKRHMLTHTNIKLFKCSDCSYECNYKESLKIHRLTHTNVKLFKCSHCSYECNYKGSLKRHILTHASHPTKL